MQDELDRIDTASIDALKKLKDEQDVLEGRIRSMDELKGTFAEAVYVRVRADYTARLDALRAEAQPLKAEARTQYASLKALIDKLESAHEAITLDRQEVELRHKLGEFDDAEFRRRTDDIEKQVTEKAGVRERAQTMRERFLAAVASEAELETPAAPNYSTSEMPVVTPAAIAAATPSNPGATTVMPLPAMPPPRDDVGSTMVMPAIRLPPAAPPVTPAGDVGTMVMQAVKPPPASSDATVVFRPARLVPQNPEAGKTTFALAIKPMAIGSDPANDIRLGGAGIDAKHAIIEPTAKGFVVRDLDTKHGTRVNAEKVAERVLANEDVVQIGVARFVFRAG